MDSKLLIYMTRSRTMCVSGLPLENNLTRFRNELRAKYASTFSGFPEDVNINAKEDVAFLLYSSGTTGLPKCAMLTHYNFVALTAICGQTCSPGKNACLYFNRPMFHLGGIAGLLMCLYEGHQLILAEGFTLEKMLAAIETYKITHSGLTPPILLHLVQTPLRHKYDTSSLQALTCLGAVAAPALISDTEKCYNTNILQGYGMTEAGVISHSDPNKPSAFSVGFMLSNAKAKIKDLQTGKDLGPGENGEIHLKGPQIMKGYFKNPEATAKAFDEEGWLRTGDIGHYDEEGMLYVVDRLKEVIKYKALQVPPAEIENVLLEHPKIADAGVIGIPDEYAGEIPKAFIVKSDESLRKEDVIKFVEGKLADHKHLRGGVEFADSIPKSITGKIKRSALRNLEGEKKRV